MSSVAQKTDGYYCNPAKNTQRGLPYIIMSCIVITCTFVLQCHVLQCHAHHFCPSLSFLVFSSRAIFTARRYASAEYAMVLCPCLSQVGVLLKRLNVGSREQKHTIARGLQFSDVKDLREIRPRQPLRGRQMQLWWVKIDDFPQITGCISKIIQHRLIVSVKGGQEVVCALSNDDIADGLE